MTLTTFQVGAAVTPVVIRTGVSHYTNRKPRHKKPTAHISYDEGINLIRTFLQYVSHKTVEDLQSFTASWVPHPGWIRTENVPIPEEQVHRAAQLLIEQLGEVGIDQVGGRNWWQWRRQNAELKAEWIEMRSHYNELKAANEKSKRIMMYMHGGGYFFGSVDEHRYQLQRHARKLKARVIAPRYRLAPQFPFPCGVHDCLAVYLYLLTVHKPNEIILAGDSAGGGMVLTLMCIMRDRGIPLPAGGILISPWVDLSHSFPSVSGDNPLDYIPPYGFHQKPSMSWPPPSDDELEAMSKSTGVSEREKAFIDKTNDLAQKLNDPETAREGQAVNVAKAKDRPAHPLPGPSHQLSIQIDGKLVTVKEQFQMYTTNALISHPLVSPALQPSLGGLPPLLIMAGGGEMLRDEQIYVAHKAANPAKYPLGETYRSKYDPEDEILKKYKPTPVQLQVWEDLCHVAPTLSFTRPAKYMYRSIAQFGAWVLARAQSTSIEIDDDDDTSIISSESRSSETESTDSIAVHKEQQDQLPNQQLNLSKHTIVGRAGDAIPVFQHHMIRQRIDRYGNIYDLAPASELPATTMEPNEVGIIKPVPVQRWMKAKKEWSSKYASIQKKVQIQRLRDRAAILPLSSPEESPPPTALAGRRTTKDEMIPKLRKGHLLAMWSGWGSKHDEATIEREEKATNDERKQAKNLENGQDSSNIPLDDAGRITTVPTSTSRSRRRSSGSKKKPNIEDRSRSRRRTMTVTDKGQVEGRSDMPPPALPTLAQSSSQVDGDALMTPPASSATDQSQLLNPLLIPKFKTAPHLRSPSHAESDNASMRSGVSIADNASTMAIFGAAGVSKETSRLPESERPATSATTGSDHVSDKASTIRSPTIGKNAADGYDTPVSRRSMERLQSHQVEDSRGHSESASMLSVDNIKTRGSMSEHMRSPSSTAIVQAEGIVGVVRGGQADRAGPDGPLVNGVIDEKENEKSDARPGMYDRADSEFQTAVEKM